MRMSAALKKDYYQFCYDENEVVSSTECSIDDDDDEEIIEQNDVDFIEEDDFNRYRQQDVVTNASSENNDSFYDTDPFDEFESTESLDPTSYSDELQLEEADREVSSPTSVESFTLDGYVIEIDESSNTININTSPRQEYSTEHQGYSIERLGHSTERLGHSTERQGYSTERLGHSTERRGYSTERSSEFLTVPTDYDDELSSSGVSLDSSNSPISSAQSLSTEIDRLRNIHHFSGFSSLRRRRSSRQPSGTLASKSAKSLESLKSRASTPERKSPISFFRSKTKSDIELSRLGKSNKTSKKTKENSMLRLKRSSSMSLKNKRKHSKQRNSMDLLSPPRDDLHNSSSTELTLQQPSPFVRTIFQFVETEFDDMFPFNSREDLTSITVYSCSTRNKLFPQDLTKNNSLSRRHKHKNNLSLIVRTVLQDPSHEPVFLSSGRRVSETADFIIAVIAYLDRIRKAQEIMEETSVESVSMTSSADVVDAQSSQSNRFQRLSLRKKYLMPLTLHERFSKLSDDVAFDEDAIITEIFPKSLSRSASSNLTLDKERSSSTGVLSHSKSLKNMSFGSLRRKTKPKQTNKASESREAQLPQTLHNRKISGHEDKLFKCNDERGYENLSSSSSSSNLQSITLDEQQENKKQRLKVIQQNKAKSHQKHDSELSPAVENDMMFSQNRNKQKVIQTTPNDELRNVNVCRNCSSPLSCCDLPQQQVITNSVEQTEKQQQQQQQTGTIRFLAEKLKRINYKRNQSKVPPDVEYWTETSRDLQVEEESGDTVDVKMQQPVVDLLDVGRDKKEASVGTKKRTGGIRRSLSWRLKKDKVKQDEPVLPKIKEKTNKFSSIRSMFEPLSPSEKKKFSVNSPSSSSTSSSSRRKSNKTNNSKATKTERGVVSLRFSKIEDEDGGASQVSTPPSSPESRFVRSSEDGSPTSASSPSLRSLNVSSEIYSSDSSSLIAELSPKGTFKRIQDSPSPRSDDYCDGDKIVVDVPMHLVPPELSRSPTSPKSITNNSTNSTKHFSSFPAKKSPNAVSPNVRSKVRLSSLEIKRGDGQSSSAPETTTATKKTSEINNNHLAMPQLDDDVSSHHSDGVLMLSTKKPPPLSPVVKPKPIKTSSIAVVKPKQVGSNIAMVIPIMKSDMNRPASPHPQPPKVNDSAAAAAIRRRTSSSIIATVKSIPANGAIVLEKWKNLEKSKDASTTKTSLISTRTTPNTPKLPRRRGANSFRRYSEGSDADYPSEKAADPQPAVRTQATIRISSRKQQEKTSEPLEKEKEKLFIDENDTSLTSSIAQYTNEINKLSENVENVENENPVVVDEEKSSIKIKSVEKAERSPKNMRTRRSRSPTNAIIVRRKSIKNISVGGETSDQRYSDVTISDVAPVDNNNNKESVDVLPVEKHVSSDVRTDERHHQEKSERKTMADICGLKLNTSNANSENPENKPHSSTPQEGGKNSLQRTTADGKPIGYATKIMGSPTLRHATRKTGAVSVPSTLNETTSIGSIIDDSPEKIQNDLDSYIEQSFRDIEKNMRRNRAAGQERAPGTDSTESTVRTRRRDRRGYKNRENNSNPSSPSDDDVFANTPSPEQTSSNEQNERLTTISNRSKLQTIKSQEEVELSSASSLLIAAKQTDQKVVLRRELEAPTQIERKNSDNTMDTMKEFEQFLRKQERKTRREIRRLSRESTDSVKSVSQEDLTTTGQTEEVTLEQYKRKQEKRRMERKQFQQKHLQERRLSLGNKWPSLGNIGNTTGKPLERKLSLPSNLHHFDHQQHSGRGPSPSYTNSSSESLSSEKPSSMEDVRTLPSQEEQLTRSASAGPLNRRHSFSGLSHKERSNSTGHSPDIDALLQHLICDIEEEIVSSGEEEGMHFKNQQLENFNTNLDMLKSQSEDSLNRSNSLPKGSSKGLVRKYCSEDQIALQARKRRRRAKRKQAVTPGDVKKSDIYSKVKQIEVCLLLEQEQKTKDAFKIETIRVHQLNTYKDIENVAVGSFIKHLQILDKQLLDISQNDISYLQVAQRRISLGSSIDLSRVDVENGCLQCQMCLKGKNEWSLASLSYDTLIPKTYLEKYVSLILTHRQVIFYGPSGTGKSYLARRVASLITHRMNNDKIPTLVYKNMSDVQWQELLETVKSEKRPDPYVILIDGFATGFIKSEKDITDVITVSASVHPQPYIICTLTQSSNYDIPTPWQNNFKWIWLPNHEEPIDGILTRFLRRKYTQHGKVGDVHQQQEAFRIADWLSATWRHVNGVLERFNSTECTIGPTMFYTCPTDLNTAEEWFIDLWNYSITPYFLHAIKCGIKLYGQRHEWLDPLEWILKTYPWNDESNDNQTESNRKSKLRRIRPEDVGYQTSNVNTQPQVDSEAEKERLLDFLRQLEFLMHDDNSGGTDDNILKTIESTASYESSI